MTQHDCSVEGVLKPGILSDLFGHTSPTVDHHGDLLAAFGLEISGYQEAALRAGFPVDGSQILARQIRQKTFEIRAMTVNPPRPLHGFVLVMDSRQQSVLVGCSESRINPQVRWRAKSQLLLYQ